MVSKIAKSEGRLLCMCAHVRVCTKINNQLFDVDKAIELFLKMFFFLYEEIPVQSQISEAGFTMQCFCFVFCLSNYKSLEALQCTRMEEGESHFSRQSFITFSDVLLWLKYSRDLTYIQIAMY